MSFTLSLTRLDTGMLSFCLDFKKSLSSCTLIGRNLKVEKKNELLAIKKPQTTILIG
jgi:hypothetical protein